MSWQAQEPGVPLETAVTTAGQIADPSGDHSFATQLPEHVELTGTMIAPHTVHTTYSNACVLKPRGADLVLTGEIDLRNADELASHVLAWLHDADNHLDLTGVDFVDSMGIVMLLRIYNAATHRGATLHITCSTFVHATLSMAGLTGNLPGLTLTIGDSD